jgi:hypothetical protein
LPSEKVERKRRIQMVFAPVPFVLSPRQGSAKRIDPYLKM